MTQLTQLVPAPADDGQSAAPARAPGPVLPSWPLTALLAPYALWWLLGLLDVILIPIAALMLVYLVRTPGVRAPRGYGLWLLFLLWMTCSVVEVTRFGAFIGFSYRYLIYAGATVLFLYVYNARSRLTARYVLGLLTVVWLTVVVGGTLGVLFPGAVVRTPTFYVVQLLKAEIPAARNLLNNELITHMVLRRFAQYNPGSYFGVAPRPAAPFRYANNWGNAYSLLLPLVVAYAFLVSKRRRALLLGVAVPLSLIPAFLTLNRGMFIGIGIAAAYVSFRLLLMGRPKAIGLVALAGLVGAALFFALPVQERIDTRLDKGGSSNDTRASLYQQSLASVPDSPVFGYGVPKEGDDPNAPSVGTQGAVWMVLVSHGPVALFSFLGWFLLAAVQSRRRRDVVGLAAHTVVFVSAIELVYYGVLPYGLPIMMLAAALALRPADAVRPRADSAPAVPPATERASR